MTSIFFSYSHKDEALRDELEVSLSMMKRQGLIQTVHDRRIVAGVDLNQAIDAYVEKADIILCLVSPDFIASDYCYSQEMARALERHRSAEAKVIPIILRHCDWKHTPLAELRGTPRDNKPVMAWSDRDEAWLNVTNDIREAVADLGCKPAPAVSTSAPTSDGGIEIAEPRPRSGNLSISREFTDLERDGYVRETFAFVQEYLANSLEEVKARHSNVAGEVTALDQNRFTMVAYRDGHKASAMTVFMGGMARAGREISFHLSDDGATNTSNGSFYLAEDDHGLGFKSMFGSFGGNRDILMRRDDLAEQIWKAFVDPLQRKESR